VAPILVSEEHRLKKLRVDDQGNIETLALDVDGTRMGGWGSRHRHTSGLEPSLKRGRSRRPKKPLARRKNRTPATSSIPELPTLHQIWPQTNLSFASEMLKQSTRHILLKLNCFAESTLLFEGQNQDTNTPFKL
jgi:hypothetical protein